MSYVLEPIGYIHGGQDGFSVALDPEYKTALTGIDGYGNVQILWWFDGCDNQASRRKMTEKKPYVNGPEVLGTFATRSPERPNPIAVSTSYVTYVDMENGILGLAWIDAREGTPVLDIKPYVPSADRVENPVVPDWCSHWPKSVDESEDFDWEAEFNF